MRAWVSCMVGNVPIVPINPINRKKIEIGDCHMLLKYLCLLCRENGNGKVSAMKTMRIIETINYWFGVVVFSLFMLGNFIISAIIFSNWPR